MRTHGLAGKEKYDVGKRGEPIMYMAALIILEFPQTPSVKILIPLRFQDGTNPRPVGQLPGC
jgi:hypothetical protein